MSFGVSKANGILIFRDMGGYETRNPSTFWCIQKADEIYKWKDFAEIVIRTDDMETNPNHYTYSKHHHYTNLVPDFNFHSWPQVGINDYSDFVVQIDAAGKLPYKINKVGWIGNTNTHPNRKRLLQIASNFSNLFDVFDCGRWVKDDANVMLKSAKYISTPELAGTYSILIDVEGNGYSGRLKHLLWSHRPVLLVDRPHKEYFFEHLKEWVHYIPVKRDMSDLVQKTMMCLNNYEKAMQVAENAHQFSKIHLSREACYAKWNDVVSPYCEEAK